MKKIDALNRLTFKPELSKVYAESTRYPAEIVVLCGANRRGNFKEGISEDGGKESDGKKGKKVTRIDPVRTTQPLEQTQEKRVCAYCRISTDSEDQEAFAGSSSGILQSAHWRQKQLDFSGIYADEDRSGTKLNGRDEFQKMMQDCQRGQHDYIITKISHTICKKYGRQYSGDS